LNNASTIACHPHNNDIGRAYSDMLFHFISIFCSAGYSHSIVSYV
jgi:hypothetical protein